MRRRHAHALTCSCRSWRSSAVRLSAEADVRPSTIMASGQTCPGGVCVEPRPCIFSPAATNAHGWSSDPEQRIKTVSAGAACCHAAHGIVCCQSRCAAMQTGKRGICAVQC